MKTRSESIWGIMSRRWALFAGFVARMDDTRLSKCALFGELVGSAGLVEGQNKEWMGCLQDDLSAFGINTNQWTTIVQDEGG